LLTEIKQEQMPYKKESPFASFRDPKRPTRNYNPTNFQMPDINAIFNKTADGDKVEEPKKSEEKNPKDKVAGDVLDKIDNPEPAPRTRKSLRQDRRAGEKELNKELRRIKQLSKASTKDITAQERKELIEAKDKIQAEKDFRKEAKKEGFNPADYKTKLMMDEQAAKVKKMDDEGKSGKFLDMMQIASRENIPMDRIKPSNIGASFPGQSSPGRAPFNDPSVLRTGEPPMSESEKRKMQMIKNPLGRGLQMNKDMKQVNSKGSGFPMLQPNQNMAEPEQMKNRAGRPQDSNILTNDPNINQPMNKVAASNFKRNSQFNDIASGQGVYNPPQSTMPMPNQPANNQTPQQQTFPQQGSFAAYSKPSRAVDNSSEEIMKAGKQMQSNIDDLKDKFGKKKETVGEDGIEFNAGLRKASAEGKLDNNPKFKAAVDNAPSMISKGPAGIKIKPKERQMKKGEKERLKNTVELPESGYGLQNPGKDMFSPSTPNKPPKGTRYNLAKDQSVKPAEYDGPGMYDGPSMRRAFKAFDHAHTKVTKGNLKATERDDAAHMSYLKRDIKYDNTHGGSKKQMLDDEKHISKLAGDLKYDAKKKRS